MYNFVLLILIHWYGAKWWWLHAFFHFLQFFKRKLKRAAVPSCKVKVKRRLLLTGCLDCCDWPVNNNLPNLSPRKTELQESKLFSYLKTEICIGVKIYFLEPKFLESKLILSFPLAASGSSPTMVIGFIQSAPRWQYNLGVNTIQLSFIVSYNRGPINGKQFYTFPIILTIGWDC